MSGKDYIQTENGLIVRERRTTDNRKPIDARRRSFLVKGGLALALIALGPACTRLAGRSPAPSTETIDSLWDAPGLHPEVTPVGSFYSVSKNLWDPVIEARNWTLQIDGMVHRPFAMDYRTLTASGPVFQQYVTLTCVSNEVGGDLTGNALWRGIRLRDVLQSAGVRDGAVDLRLEGEDDYTDSIPIEKAMHPDTLLVWEMNGEPLTPKHGFPARLIVPGIYGMKNVKWIRRMEVVNYDYKGYWARRGWSDEAVVKTWSRIDAPPGPRLSSGVETILGGLAYGGGRGITRVEASVDGGRTWQEAKTKEPLGPWAWRLWAMRWTPDATGRPLLLVRATDGTGVTQSETPVDPLPDGAEGYHSLRANVG